MKEKQTAWSAGAPTAQKRKSHYLGALLEDVHSFLLGEATRMDPVNREFNPLFIRYI